MADPFESLGGRDLPVAPDPAFATRLRRQMASLLATDDIPTSRRTTMPTTTASETTTARADAPTGAATTATVRPYLTVHDGAGALAFYAEAFGAVEVMRIAMEGGALGHAEFRIGGAPFYLSDEFPEMGVTSPRTLGGTTVAVHLEVDDVDGAFARAVAAGAEALMEPADQPHGARHGTLLDPYGHRWMLSRQVEQVSIDVLAERMAEAGMDVVASAEAEAAASGSAVASPGGGAIWAALNYADAPAGIAFMVDVLGFEAQLVVPGDDPSVVEHSQLRWPEGGVVQAASAARPGNVFSDRPTGAGSLYVVTADPMAVYDRCVAAGVEVISEPETPDYDPDGMVFSIRDPEGNLWSFGTYAG
ncbi:MAG: VOC family protein [Acidimicrobiales bacterium]